jgi:hypothetical protein
MATATVETAFSLHPEDLACHVVSPECTVEASRKIFGYGTLERRKAHRVTHDPDSQLGVTLRRRKERQVPRLRTDSDAFAGVIDQ